MSSRLYHCIHNMKESIGIGGIRLYVPFCAINIACIGPNDGTRWLIWETSTRRWYWRNCSTHLQHGGGSRQLQTGSELTHSFVAVSDSVYTASANQLPRNWSTQLTMHCLNASYTTRTTCYIHCYLILTQQVIVWDSDATTESYFRRLVACRVITF